MATPKDITEQVLREPMEEAERQIERGDFTGAARTCAETYQRFLEERPEAIPGSYLEAGVSAPAGLGSRPCIWPPLGGINVAVGADLKPRIIYEKQRFSLSEAVSYFEFLLQHIVDSERAAAASV